MEKQILQADYTKIRQPKQLVLPLNAEYLIAKDEPVRLLDQVLEELDYTALYLTYSEKGRNPAVDAVTLFKIVVYAFSQGTYSTRKIETACQYDVRYRYLLQGYRVPDHNMIYRFIKHHLEECMSELFSQLVKKLIEYGEITLTQVFLDGTKIEANANKYTFVWKKSVEKYRAKLQEKAKEYLQTELQMTDLSEPVSVKDLKRALRSLGNRIKKEKIVFVYGSGKRKTPLQRQYETVEEMLNRAQFYEEALEIMGNDRSSYSKTDPDATFMHMKEDHMRNSQLKPGYNVQVAATGEYIAGILINADRNDYYALIPMIELLEEAYPEEKIGKLVADAGYESEEGYDYLSQKGIGSYIKPSNHEYSKTKKYRRDMEFRLAMQYDKEHDTYTCKNGRKLTYNGTRTKKNRNGYVSESRIYKCEDCSNCPYYGKCYKGKYTKTIQINEKFDSFRAESEKNITSEEGNLLRVNRSIQAEGVFGITKQDMGFDRFLRRGVQGTLTEYLLLACGFNINKLHHRIQEGRLGQDLLIPAKMQKKEEKTA